MVFAREWGGKALALALVPAREAPIAQVSVLGGQGAGVSGLRVRVNGRPAQACGQGCYRTTIARRARAVAVEGPGVVWHVPLPSAWPPADATGLVRRAAAVWRSLRSLSFRERLASDATHVVTSTWRTEAPDRVAYDVAGGWSGIVVGAKRWDRAPGADRWAESPQTPLTQPLPPWVRIQDARVLGATRVGGRAAWRVSFFDPGTPAWFTIAVDRTTYRTLETRMITTAHFMHDVYGRFNATPPIAPPG